MDSQPIPAAKPLRGQALVEFVIVLPVIIMVLFGIFYLGWAMLIGSNAASAVEEPVMQKLALADIPGDATGTALGLIQGYTAGSIPLKGAPVDSVSPQFTNNVTAILAGKKLFNAPIPYVSNLSFNFSVTQDINSNLLKANNAAGQTGTLGSPALGTTSAVIPYSVNPSGAGTIDPTLYGIGISDVPPKIALSDLSCEATSPINLSTVNTAGSADYMLTAFANAATPPGIGGFSASYSATSATDTSVIANLPNTACDSSGSVTAYTTACMQELSALSTNSTNSPGVTDVSTGVTTQTNQTTNSPATGKTTTTVVTTYPGSLATPPATPVVPPPISPATPTTDAAGNTVTTTVTLDAVTGVTTQTVVTISSTALPAGTGTGNVANPAAFTAACITKKQLSCRAQYNNKYLSDVISVMTAAGGCTGRANGTAADVTFKPSTQPY